MKREKKIYFSAKFTDKTSPSMVAKEYYKHLEPYVYTCKKNSKIIRFAHFIINLKKVDTVFILGLSKMNYLVTKISKMFGKKTVFLMHSYRKIEDLYDYDIYHLRPYEEKILEISEKIICVSKHLSDTVKKDLPIYRDKIFWVNNGITKYVPKEKVRNQEYTIMSTGGGLRIKNNLSVCKAIEKIQDKKIRFIVIGNLGIDGDEIKKYPFVEFYEYLPHDVVLKKMQETDLYIQNSFYESFGLGVCEAICMECKVLISKNIGMIDVLKDFDENVIIQDNQSIDEIQKKIIWAMNNEQVCKLNFDENMWEISSRKIIKLINKKK